MQAENRQATAKNAIRNTIWYMVSVSANSVVRHAAHRGGDAAEEHGIAEREQRAEAELSAPGAATSSTPRKPTISAAAAREPDFLLQPERREQRGEQRRGKIDGDRAGRAASA